MRDCDLAFDGFGVVPRSGTLIIASKPCYILLCLSSLLIFDPFFQLLLLNITTIEQVRNQAHRKLTKSSTPANPFSIGRWYHNLAYLLFRPAGYDWVDLSGLAMHDTRKVNPGFIVRPASAAEVSEDQDETREGSREDWR